MDEIQRGEGPEDQQAVGVPAADIKRIPPWSKQLTARGLVASFVIGSMYSVIVMKLNLTTGLVPTFNVSAALLAFVFLRTWTKLLQRAGVVSRPFTRQENTVVQTCAVACYSVAVGGGFGSYLLGLSKKTYEQVGLEAEGNVPGSYKEPGVGWMTVFLFVVSFVGLMALVPLRKWFFSGEGCGFSQLPSFGLQALKQKYALLFLFDFSLTYVGAGMICSHLVNLSLLFGAVLSWGILWPMIRKFKGDWYPGTLPESSMRSLQGYKVFISIALILGDGLYNFVKTLVVSISSLNLRSKGNSTKIAANTDVQALGDLQRNEAFMRESIPVWFAYAGYAFFSIGAVFSVRVMFPGVKWHYVVISYMVAPALSFCNAYGAGLTDMSMAYNYGKISLFILAAWAGRNSGIVAGLVGCGLIKSVVSVSSDLMHDFKTGHLTLTSPRSMLLSQAVGMAMGCVIAPLTFFLFYKAFDVGNPTGIFKAPYAVIYRNMAILGIEGFSALPQHCLQLCAGFFGFAVVANMARDLYPANYGRWIPLPMVIAIPFLVGPSFAVDMCMGSLAVFAWHWLDTKNATSIVAAAASGLICGDGLWTLPSSLLALTKINPPICMRST
ncbi:hypothetical protein Taro_018938 [Colocasia esculenta]|uniref:Uncharacterized protein n=1 Tax=Colocasia esculenta TaxID=4460 RepID=A0A843US22_COLES|nr:hypothetical protein [Colocasia esculenta]